MSETSGTGESVGFIGVGRMGGLMARRLVDAGLKVVVFDTSQEAMAPLVAAGAIAADSVKAVADAAEIVLASLPTPAVVEQVALGPGGVAEGAKIKIFVDTSTTGSTYAKRIAEGLQAKGITQVDAPVSGGLAGAEKGTLAVMVSSPDETYPKVEPVLQHLGKLFWVGKLPGQGQTMKLANNLLSATAMAITSEAVTMATKAGLDPVQALEVINAGTGRNSASVDKFPKYIVQRKFNLGFAVSLLDKDIRLCLEEAAAMGIPMLVGSAVRQVLQITVASEGPQADMTDIVKPLEKWAGVEIKAKS